MQTKGKGYFGINNAEPLACGEYYSYNKILTEKRTLTGMQLLPRGHVLSEALEVLRHYDVLYTYLEREECLQPGYR